jgi:hypothetical protein
VLGTPHARRVEGITGRAGLLYTCDSNCRRVPAQNP